MTHTTHTSHTCNTQQRYSCFCQTKLLLPLASNSCPHSAKWLSQTNPWKYHQQGLHENGIAHSWILISVQHDSQIGKTTDTFFNVPNEGQFRSEPKTTRNHITMYSEPSATKCGTKNYILDMLKLRIAPACILLHYSLAYEGVPMQIYNSMKGKEGIDL